MGAQEPVTKVIPIEPYFDTWDYVSGGGKVRNCGYYLRGRFRAVGDYTAVSDYTYKITDTRGRVVSPGWSISNPKPDEWFDFGVGGTWASGPNSPGKICPQPYSLDLLSPWTATLTIPAPRVSFTNNASQVFPGSVTFFSGAVDPKRKLLSLEWTFGDGDGDSFVNPVHEYAKPGDYKVTLKATNPAGAFNSFTGTVKVAAPTLSVGMAFVDRKDSHPTLGETVKVRATVSAGNGLGALTGLRFDGANALGVPELFEVVTPPASTAIGELPPGESRSFEWTLRVVHAGRFVLGTAPVVGFDAANRPVTARGSLPGEISGMKVEVVFPKEPVLLKKLPQKPGELSSKPGYEPASFPVKVKVSVPDKGEPVKAITLQGWAQSDGGLDVDKVLATGDPERPWVLAVPQPVPFPVTVERKPTLATAPGILRAGDKPVEFDFVVKAERPGSFQFASLFTAAVAVDGGGVLQERGSNIQPVLGDLVLSVQVEVVNKPAQIKEGEEVEVFGLVKNLTDNESILLDPIRIISLGQGAVFGPIKQTEKIFPPLGSLSIFAPILTPEGEDKEARFRARVRTSRLPGLDQRTMERRQAVALDFAVGGQVLGEDGQLREIALENIAVEWGNGGYSEAGTTYLRVPVEPNPARPRELGWADFALQMYGNALESLAGGAKEGAEIGLHNAYVFFASLPETAWSLKNFAESVAAEHSESFMRQARYQAAMEQWMISSYTGISEQTRKAEVDEISAEITAYYGRKSESGAKIKAWVNNGISTFFRKVLDSKDRAFEHDYEFNAETAKFMTSWVRPATKTVISFVTEEAVTDLAVGMFLSRISRSPRVADDVATAAERQAAKDAAEVEAAAEAIAKQGDAGHPSLVEAPSDLRNLRGGATMNQSQATRAYAVDRVTDQNLINYSKHMPVIIAIRSRADETLEWMRTKLGMTPKPVTVKQKNVDLIDEEFLEYRKGVGYGDELGRGGGDRGSVILAEPIPPHVVEAKLVGASEELRQQVVERYRTRWEEWYGDGSLPADPNQLPFDSTIRPGSKAVELKDLANKTVIGDGKTTRTTLKGSIKAPKRGSVPDPSINSDVNEAFKGQGMEPRQLELRQVIEPPGNEHFGGRDREYYEVWIEDEPVGVGENRRGALRRVSGDVDVVIAADVAGYKFGLNPKLKGLVRNRGLWEYGNQVARTLQHIMKAQHPWSSSLGRVRPNLTLDTKIEKMRAKYLKDHVWNKDPKLRGEPLLCYVNGERRIAWFDPSKNIDPDNPLSALLFLDGLPASVDDVVREQWEGRNLLPKPEDVAPKLIDTSLTAVRKALIDNDHLNGTTLLATCAIGAARTTGATIYRLSKAEELEERRADGTWTKTSPGAECGPEGIVVVPETALSEDVLAGVLRLPIIQELLGPNWKDLFRIGDDILIAPGTPEEELNTVANHGSLILAKPLRFSHPAGTRVVLVLPSLNTTTTTGPLVWLRADVGVERQGANVLTWKDQAGGVLFVNPEGGRDGLPLWMDSGLGMPVIQFKGDEWISGGLDKRLTKATIFTLSRFTTPTSSSVDYLYAIGAPGTAGGMMNLARRATDDVYHYDGKTAYADAKTVLPGNAWQVLTQVYGELDPASQQVFLNGKSVFSSKSTTPYNVDASQMFLGNYTSGSFFLIGDLLEWMVFDRVLDAKERLEVEIYLKKRGGLYSPSPPAGFTITTRPAIGRQGWGLSWPAQAGQEYQLERSETMAQGTWIVDRTLKAESTGIMEVTPDIGPRRQFYRVRVGL